MHNLKLKYLKIIFIHNNPKHHIEFHKTYLLHMLLLLDFIPLFLIYHLLYKLINLILLFSHSYLKNILYLHNKMMHINKDNLNYP